ncbi:MAG: hypothetical protein D3923_19720 [Candidatus Electrothrix sp. AR3]|nr:hypothetical protein [Candidatus Electrothrix sp. AR3]
MRRDCATCDLPALLPGVKTPVSSQWARGNNMNNVGNVTAFKSEKVEMKRNITHPTGLIFKRKVI